MVKSINRRTYFVALIITAFIFIMGLLLGLNFAAKQISFFQQETYGQKLDFDSLQLQDRYASFLSKEQKCDEMLSLFEKNIERYEGIREKLEDSSKIFSERDSSLLLRDYVLKQVNFWIFARELKKECNNSDYVTVVFFYTSKEDCTLCDEQAKILTEMKERFKQHLFVFSFDSSFNDEEFISILLNNYDVSVYPSIIVEDNKYSGLVEKNKLFNEICENYERAPQTCFEG